MWCTSTIHLPMAKPARKCQNQGKLWPCSLRCALIITKVIFKYNLKCMSVPHWYPGFSVLWMTPIHTHIPLSLSAVLRTEPRTSHTLDEFFTSELHPLPDFLKSIVHLSFYSLSAILPHFKTTYQLRNQRVSERMRPRTNTKTHPQSTEHFDVSSLQDKV